MSANHLRLIHGLALVVGGGFLLAAFLWLGYAENKSAAILLGIAAVISGRLIYVNLPEFLERRLGTDNTPPGQRTPDTSEKGPQDDTPRDRSGSL